MPRLGLTCCLSLLGLFSAWSSMAQRIYFDTSSSTLSQNTIGSVAANGGGQVTVLTATGPGLNQLNRCTAAAVDGLNGKLFLIDGETNALWSMNLDGTGLALVRGGLTSFPTDLALDVLNRRIFYSTSSTIQGGNTVQQVDYTGANNTTIFIAGGASGNGVSRCTAIALDAANSILFLADAGAQKIWSMSTASAGLTDLVDATNSFPTGLALDVANQQIYFTLSSARQRDNQIGRINYSGAGLTILFTAAGAVERCTALDVDTTNGAIYLSDAGANTLWRIPIGGGNPAVILSGLNSTVKKLRWYSGPQTPPTPGLVAINVTGQDVVLSATNGFAGGTYSLLTSTNVALPLSLWSPVSTTVLGARGNFSITATNGFSSDTPAQFFTLRVR